jgi:hypothetical protein
MKLYLIVREGRPIDYTFDKKEARWMIKWYKDIDNDYELRVIRVRKLRKKRNGREVYVNLDDPSERILIPAKR